MKIIDGDALLDECIYNTCKVCSGSNYGRIPYEKCPHKKCMVGNVLARIEMAPAVAIENLNENLSDTDKGGVRYAISGW